MSTDQQPQVIVLAIAVALALALTPVSGHSDPMGVHSSEHLAHHMRDFSLGDSVGPVDQREQQEYYYFKMHDLDNNGRLDGAELVKSLLDHSGRGHEGEASAPLGEHNLEATVDQILRDEDTNGDGYIDYTEFVAAQRRNAAGL